MLARLLRFSIFGQWLIGAALACWFLPLWAALLLPVFTLLLVDTYSCLLSRDKNEPWSDWFRSLFGEYRAGIVIFLLRQPWTRKAPQRQGDGARIPVLLVHGYVCNHRIWDPIAARLRAQGHVVHAINLEPLFTSIDRYAEPIEAAVQGLLAHSGAKQVALVGHSMGGLAIRAWLRAHGTQRVARVVTLGTPHRGTQIPQHGKQSPNGRQMMWNSEWLNTLAASETDATRALFRIALSPQDNIVYPQRAQVLQGIAATVFPGRGHLELCLDEEVIAWVLKELSA